MRMRGRHMASAFRAWTDWSGRRAEHRRRLLPALARLRSRALAAAHAGWRAAVASSKAKRLLAKKVLLHVIRAGIGESPSGLYRGCLNSAFTRMDRADWQTAQPACLCATAGSVLYQKCGAPPRLQWVAVQACGVGAPGGTAAGGCGEAAAPAACDGAQQPPASLFVMPCTPYALNGSLSLPVLRAQIEEVQAQCQRCGRSF